MTIQLAQNIRTFRKQRALTQEQLAEVLGVTVGYISGKRGFPCRS